MVCYNFHTVLSMTWKQFEDEIKDLSRKIDFSPDIIVGIVRGGIIPARFLSTFLHVKNMFCLTVQKSGSKRTITTSIDTDIKGKSILLVEDILETGKSMIVVKNYLEEKGAIVKTACLYTMPESVTKPDYYVKEISQEISFPWE